MRQKQNKRLIGFSLSVGLLVCFVPPAVAKTTLDRSQISTEQQTDAAAPQVQGAQIGAGATAQGEPNASQSTGVTGAIAPPTQTPTTANPTAAMPKAVDRKKPSYPRRALRRGVTGHVLIEYQIQANGRVANVRILEATPPGVFDTAVLKAVEKWKFEPVDSPVTKRVQLSFQ